MAGHQSRIPEGACFRPASSRLLDQVREVMRHYHYSLASERTYVQWIVKYVQFHGTRHPRELGKRHIEAFLTHLAVAKNCAASTQKQAYRCSRPSTNKTSAKGWPTCGCRIPWPGSCHRPVPSGTGKGLSGQNAFYRPMLR